MNVGMLRVQCILDDMKELGLRDESPTWGWAIWILIGIQFDNVLRVSPQPLRQNFERLYRRVRRHDA